MQATWLISGLEGVVQLELASQRSRGCRLPESRLRIHACSILQQGEVIEAGCCRCELPSASMLVVTVRTTPHPQLSFKIPQRLPNTDQKALNGSTAVHGCGTTRHFQVPLCSLSQASMPATPRASKRVQTDSTGPLRGNVTQKSETQP